MQPTNPARAHGLRGGQVGACRPGGKGGFCRGMKQESLSSGAPPTMPTVPAGAAFQAPTGAQSAHATPLSAAPTSVVTAVKIGVRAVVTARMITIAKMTSFARDCHRLPACRRACQDGCAARHGALCARARSSRAASCTTTQPRASARSAGQRPRMRRGASRGAAPSASRRARRRSASRSCSPPAQPEGRGTKRGRGR